MPARPAFSGLRLEFLLGEVDRYTTAIANGTKEDVGKDIIRRYFKRFPPELPHDQEPSADHLAAVDDSAPDPEVEGPNPMDYPEDQKTYYALEVAWYKRLDDIENRKKSILRFLKRKANPAKESAAKPKPPRDDPTDFIEIMKCQLLGEAYLGLLETFFWPGSFDPRILGYPRWTLENIEHPRTISETLEE
ncbi:hypothetical protein CVT26_005017 [Gymnopilus dilepis]|uniref:Uncharacterized protein n=1 Tax=Gymnopilus dilepis TaxID=231916 RepID=A0A409WZ32_9AGAR|nr:hypothetical protein CVT26_005017 [Gymnopilus dilepis]